MLWGHEVTGEDKAWDLDGVTQTGIALLETVADGAWRILTGRTSRGSKRALV